MILLVSEIYVQLFRKFTRPEKKSILQKCQKLKIFAQFFSFGLMSFARGALCLLSLSNQMIRIDKLYLNTHKIWFTSGLKFIILCLWETQYLGWFLSL